MLGPSSGTPGLGLPIKRRILRTGRTGARMGADCGRPLVGAAALIGRASLGIIDLVGPAALIGRASLGIIELTGCTRPPCDDIGRCDGARAEPGLWAEPGLMVGTHALTPAALKMRALHRAVERRT